MTRSKLTRLLLIAALVSTTAAAAPSSAEGTERPLFIFAGDTRSDPTYYEMWGDNWLKHGHASADCSDCETYFGNYIPIGYNKVVPARTGQQLIVHQGADGAASLTENNVEFGGMTLVYLCPRGQTSNSKTCWEPATLIVRRLDHSFVTKTPFGSTVQNMFAIVRQHQGWIGVTSETDKDGLVAQMQGQAIRQAEQHNNELQRAAREQTRLAQEQATLINQMGQQPIGSILFCSTDPHWLRAPGDAVDRQSLVCHLTGKPNFPPLMGAALLTSGWTIASENRRTERSIIIVDMGTVETTEVTLRKAI
jgi:hypothetical protein